VDLAQRAIADLDRALARTGQVIELQRIATDGEGVLTPLSVGCPAKVSTFQPQDLNNVGAADSIAIISPTPLALAGWPAPPKEDDRLIIGGADSTTDDDAFTATIDTVQTERLLGVAVRYTLRFRT
jgi:hypothetical protein